MTTLEYRNLVGFVAGTFTTISFLPQVLKTLKERNTKPISLGMYFLFCMGVSLWLLYGLLIASWPVIISNLVTLILAGVILFLKIKHG